MLFHFYIRRWSLASEEDLEIGLKWWNLQIKAGHAEQFMKDKEEIRAKVSQSVTRSAVASVAFRCVVGSNVSWLLCCWSSDLVSSVSTALGLVAQIGQTTTVLAIKA